MQYQQRPNPISVSPVALVAAALALAVIVGSFLPWASASVFGISDTVRGTEFPRGEVNDFLLANGTLGLNEGVATLLLGLLALAAIGASFMVRELRAAVWGVAAGAFALASAVAIVDLIQTQRLLADYDGGPSWGLWMTAVVAILGTLFSLGSFVGMSSRGSFAAAPWGMPQVVIQNHASAQMGHDQYAGGPTVGGAGARYATSSARIGVIESGRPLPDVQVSGRDVLIVGRDASANIRISDSRASRRHLEIRIDGSTWIVRDLGAMNPARILSSRGEERQVQGGTTRLEHGQIAVGDSIITLYPLNGRN